ncbi:hypothetical protein EI94DRAFT_1696118 [Lactarius quietus]|nr:hypothetical protein EI94DRAFT_1696118 [Lactarius quietus]
MASLTAILNEPTPPSSPQRRAPSPSQNPDITGDEQVTPAHETFPIVNIVALDLFGDFGQGVCAQTTNGADIPPVISLSDFDPFCMTSMSPISTLKRPSQAIQDHAEVVCKRMCLALLSAKKVHKFIEPSIKEQNLTVYGELLKLVDRINIIQPVDAVFRIPALLKKKIEEHIFKALLRDNLPFYVKKKEDITAIVQVCNSPLSH